MKIAVIGTGNMGQALVAGFLAKNLLQPSEICVYDADLEKAKAFSEKMHCTFAADPISAVHDADYCLLAVKPQIIDRAVTDLIPGLSDHTVVISIAASVKIQRLRSLLGDSKAIVRVMPNTPALVGAAVNAICCENVKKSDEEFVYSLFASCGIVVPCSEPQLDAIGCVSGTGPAYVMLFIESLADAAVKLGIPRDTALRVAAQTVYGSGKLAVDTGTHPAILKDQVCSPGGTTIEGVIALEKNGLRAAVEAAVEAADTKTKILSGGA